MNKIDKPLVKVTKSGANTQIKIIVKRETLQ